MTAHDLSVTVFAYHIPKDGRLPFPENPAKLPLFLPKSRKPLVAYNCLLEFESREFPVGEERTATLKFYSGYKLLENWDDTSVAVLGTPGAERFLISRCGNKAERFRLYRDFLT